VLFAYLFGIRYDISEYEQAMKGMNIDIIEDVAQSFVGP
jgi:dTDP-4-amino-4,6-dideoxygalactose transaminase